MWSFYGPSVQFWLVIYYKILICMGLFVGISQIFCRLWRMVISQLSLSSSHDEVLFGMCELCNSKIILLLQFSVVFSCYLYDLKFQYLYFTSNYLCVDFERWLIWVGEVDIYASRRLEFDLWYDIQATLPTYWHASHLAQVIKCCHFSIYTKREEKKRGI